MAIMFFFLTCDLVSITSTVLYEVGGFTWLQFSVTKKKKKIYPSAQTLLISYL